MWAHTNYARYFEVVWKVEGSVMAIWNLNKRVKTLEKETHLLRDGLQAFRTEVDRRECDRLDVLKLKRCPSIYKQSDSLAGGNGEFRCIHDAGHAGTCANGEYDWRGGFPGSEGR